MRHAPSKRSTARRGVPFAAALMLGACSGEDGTGTRSVTSAVAPIAASTTAVPEVPPASAPPTGVPPTDVPPSSLAPEASGAVQGQGDSTAELCPTGEYPASGSFDLASGALAWSTCSPEEAYRTVVGVSEELLLLDERSDTGSGETIAVNTDDGTERWRLSTAAGLGTVVPGPIDAQAITVLPTDVEGAPFVIAVDSNTGEERWRLDPGEILLGHTEDTVIVSEVLAGTSTSPPGLRGVDRVTGEERWTNDVVFSDMSGVGVARGAAAITDAMIAVPTGTELTAVNTATGAPLWSAPQLDHPATADGVLVGSEPSNSPRRTMRAVDAANGDTLWTGNGQPSYGELWAVGDGIVAVVDADTGTELVAYDLATGDERWHAPRMSNGQPQLISGTSIVLLWESDLAVVSSTDGTQTWSATQPLRSPLMNSVGSNTTHVFVAVNSLPWGD